MEPGSPFFKGQELSRPVVGLRFSLDEGFLGLDLDLKIPTKKARNPSGLPGSMPSRSCVQGWRVYLAVPRYFIFTSRLTKV